MLKVISHGRHHFGFDRIYHTDDSQHMTEKKLPQKTGCLVAYCIFITHV